MALFKPEKSSNPGVNYYGICDIAILGFTDKSSQFDWADIYLDVSIKQKGSDYTKSIRINGSFEREADGSISGGSVINRLYHFFDVLGVKAGVNDYVGYVYKEKPKQPGGKVFTRVHHKINVNSTDGRNKLTSDMNWMRDKGYLKEAPAKEGWKDVSVEEMDEVFGSDAMSNM